MKHSIITVIRLTIVLLVLCGLVYPAFITGVAQVTMKEKANGSLLYDENNRVVGSKLIGQSFADPRYFHGRVSSIDYQSGASGSNNYAPSNPELKKRVKESIAKILKENPSIEASDIPVDLITNSGSGLDPDITPESAFIQVDRVATNTGISKESLKKLVKENVKGGVIGEKRVNVVELNLEIQKRLQ